MDERNSSTDDHTKDTNNREAQWVVSGTTQGQTKKSMDEFN